MPLAASIAVMTKLVLASTSPARLTLLRAGGIEPITIAPEVDEDLVAEREIARGAISGTADLVLTLARAKAEAVANRPEARGALILGCDSSLEFAGASLGKPHEPAIAIDRWRQLRGQSGALHTGHWLIDNRSPELGKVPPATGKASSTVVHFANLSDREIEDYVATGEPLKVAGAFTLDGLGGAFIDRIEGDPHTVIGLSLSVLRELTGRLQVHYSSLWQIAQGK